MPALEAVPFVAEHQRARGHQFAAEWRVVLEAASENDRDRVAGVPLFEGPIDRARRAQHIRNRPALTTRDDSRRGAARRSLLSAARQRALEVDRNFRQDPISSYNL